MDTGLIGPGAPQELPGKAINRKHPQHLVFDCFDKIGKLFQFSLAAYDRSTEPVHVLYRDQPDIATLQTRRI